MEQYDCMFYLSPQTVVIPFKMVTEADLNCEDIHECMDCGTQWAENRANICHWCDSLNVELVCVMRDQFHLLRHPDAQP